MQFSSESSLIFYPAKQVLCQILLASFHGDDQEDEETVEMKLKDLDEDLEINMTLGLVCIYFQIKIKNTNNFYIKKSLFIILNFTFQNF